MAKRITKLTSEQEALIPIRREEWRATGLSTARIAPDAAREAVRNLYAASGLAPPQAVLVAQSPMQALLMRGVLCVLGNKKLSGQLWDQLGEYDLPDGAHWMLVHERLGLEYGDVFSFIADDPEFFGYTEVTDSTRTKTDD